jgi:hypothetical protein
MGQSKTPYTDTITPQFIDWLLYDLPFLKQICDEIMPNDFADIIEFHARMKTMVRSKIESVALRRAQMTSALDAVDRAIKKLPTSEHKKIYRMKWRAGMTVREISKQFFKDKKMRFFSVPKIQEKTEQVRTHVALYLQAIPGFEFRIKLIQKLIQDQAE